MSNVVKGCGISGVVVKKLVRYSDERGYFMEILRDDDSFFSKFGQSSVSLTKPGVIKAFHWHDKQDDLFFVVSGRALVVLYDRRTVSSTFGITQTIVMGDGEEPVAVFIPKGVAHGYKALGNEPVVMLYHMTESYDAKSPDEQRIDPDDPSIGFDWCKGE